ncbi:MAG TPA: ATP-dependent DNA helicase [Solirubrobacteraceae bacterium]|nr:ATP-dependent DNA helicase [Solirubrobacteraceae bacterium]
MIGADAAAIADWKGLVDHAGTPLILRGPAGSGKTEFLIARFRWLVEQGVIPDRIVWLAPTEARADAARIRLEADLREGYSELVVGTPAQLAALILRRAGTRPELLDATLSPGDRLAMLAERIDELPLAHHDFGGNVGALLGRFIRRIDRLKAELIEVEAFADWAAATEDPAEREFAEVFRAHQQMLTDSGACDEGDLVRLALRLISERPASRQPFEHVLVDDAQELDLAPARLAAGLGGTNLTVVGDPLAALRRFRGAGATRLDGFRRSDSRVVQLVGSHRCPPRIMEAAWALGLDSPGAREDPPPAPEGDPGRVEFWRCANERAQAQAVAAEIERLITRDGLAAGRVAVLVPEIVLEGQAVSVALEERAVPHRLVGEAAFFQRAEIRDLLAWLRLLADPGDAPAVVRALARPPIGLRSIDIARCTQIARRRKLDMVAALAAATESPQVPPEARERIRVFLKLYRAGAGQVDTVRPDLYVHRLIERIGLRRQQLFAAQADVVERLRALARFGELAAAFVARAPQATPREFARSIAAVADFGLREHEEPDLADPSHVQVLGLDASGGLQVDHVFVLGLRAGLSTQAEEAIPDALLEEPLPPDEESTRAAVLRQRLYGAVSRARRRAVLSYPSAADRGPAISPAEPVEAARRTLGAVWEDRDEELFGPAETLQSTYRLLRDELLEGTMRAGARLGELRFDTDLDVSHAVVRYLELLKLAALLSRPEGQGVGEALRDVNARISQAVTAEQREIFTSSPLDDYLLDAERDVRRRSQVMAARDEPSLERFLPLRGDGVVLSASDIDTYRICPLRYKFARVFRIPQEPTLHQRFGIVIHQVLERYHAAADPGAPLAPLAELLGLLETAWRRSGFGDSEEERQLRGKAAAALARYHERAGSEESQPVWFERSFTFRLGPNLLRGRVDRVDRLPSGEYELIDYKTGRPKTAEQLAEDVQLSLYAIGAREAWSLEASRGAYYYLLDDQKVAIPGDEERAEWIRSVAAEVAAGIKAQEFEPTPSIQACSMCDYRLVCPAAER